jgi:hypothetical protein
MSKTFKLRESDMERLASNLAKLPEHAYYLDLSMPVGSRIITLVKGEMGYHPYSQADGDENTPHDILQTVVNELNARFDVTPAQAEAMHMGSIFGYHVPGADPDSEVSIKMAARHQEENLAKTAV